MTEQEWIEAIVADHSTKSGQGLASHIAYEMADARRTRSEIDRLKRDLASARKHFETVHASASKQITQLQTACRHRRWNLYGQIENATGTLAYRGCDGGGPGDQKRVCLHCEYTWDPDDKQPIPRTPLEPVLMGALSPSSAPPTQSSAEAAVTSSPAE